MNLEARPSPATRQDDVLIWAIAWFVAGAALFVADVFSAPRRGPLWVAVVFGLTAWSVAGAATFHRAQVPRGLVLWALAYIVAFSLGGLWADRFERNGWPGFVGALLGWGAGAALGALASGFSARNHSRFGPLVMAVAWGATFVAGGYLGIVAGMILAQSTRQTLAFLGEGAALTLAWGLGAALGGAVAAALGFAVRDAMLGKQ
jgi:hypothetical protein